MGHYIKLFTCLISLLSFTTGFAQYNFIGNGNWNNPANWQGGVIPPEAHGVNVTISGNCTLVVDAEYKNNGVLWIKNTGTLTIEGTNQPFDQFTCEYGTTVTVDGQLINKVILRTSATFTVTGTVTNHSTFQTGVPLTIKNGATFHNATTGLFASGQFALEQGSNFINNGKLFGTFTLTGQGSVTNGGIIAPGNSPGAIEFNGSYAATASSIHNFEIGGTAANAYDRLIVGGTATLGGTLNVSLINGFAPSASNPGLPIITGTISGTFATVNKPSQYQLVYNANNVSLHYLTILPVTFSNVGAKKAGNGVNVSWEMQTESNVLHYQIEKSINARDFVKIGEVVASALNRYQYNDHSVRTTAFYRIKSIDKDGKVSYSVIVRYSEGKSSVDLRVFPSVVNGKMNVQHSTAGVHSKIVIYAVDGRVVQTVFPANGAQNTMIDVSALNRGTYFVRYGMGEKPETVKFTKN